ncbi:MAG: hypothetical protein IJ179_02110 [Oscillospiraceae bacterium]|nr:hypothetical protein [Oscillospiraceae bacterium]
MDFIQEYGQYSNFVFIGEAGSGKSEIAVNIAQLLAAGQEKPVHFFDLDMTKPIFRSRDLAQTLAEAGIEVHFEEQYMDAPTLTGGVVRLLKDESSVSVLDVGGDAIGARSIGGYSPYLNRENTCIFYVVNSYRPWSADIEHIDQVLSQILGVSHIHLQRLVFLGNPNLGIETTAEEFLRGCDELDKVLGAYVSVAFYCIEEKLMSKLTTERKLLPLHLQMGYEWQ